MLKNFNSLYSLNYINYLTSIIGLVFYLISQNIISLIKIPKIKFKNLFNNNNEELKVNKIKKDPIINVTKEEDYKIIREATNEYDWEDEDLTSKYFLLH